LADGAEDLGDAEVPFVEVRAISDGASLTVVHGEQRLVGVAVHGPVDVIDVGGSDAAQAVADALLLRL
jgi:hypothetical protein